MQPYPEPGVAVVLALAGTAVAASTLKLANFEPSSRDRLAGTGVIQYAAQNYTTGAINTTTPQTFSVKCELTKKATSGGFVVRIYALGPTAVNQPLSVYSNCVKSRNQNGTPPS